MYCRNCGNQIPGNAKFCGFCGCPAERPQEKSRRKSKAIPVIVILASLILIALIVGSLLWVSGKNQNLSKQQEKENDEAVSVETDEEETVEIWYRTQSVTEASGVEIIFDYEYNDFAQLLSTTVSYHSEDMDKTYKAEEFEWDKNGNLSSFVIYNSSAKIVEEHQYQFNDDGLLTKYSGFIDGSHSWDNRYQYNSQGQHIGSEMITGESYMSVEAQYTPEGNPDRIIRYFEDGTVYMDSDFEYNERGHVAYIGTSITDQKVSERYEYEYDEDGTVLYKDVYNNDSSIRDYREEYSYDEEGRLLSVIRYFKDGTSVVSVEYEYDSKGRLISEIYHEDNGDFLNTEKEVWFYDLNGNAQDETVVSAGYEYDDYGNIITETRYQSIILKHTYESVEVPKSIVDRMFESIDWVDLYSNTDPVILEEVIRKNK